MLVRLKQELKGALKMNELEYNQKATSEYTVGKNKYIITSHFVGDKDVKDSILKLAEKRAIKEMGLDKNL